MQRYFTQIIQKNVNPKYVRHCITKYSQCFLYSIPFTTAMRVKSSQKISKHLLIYFNTSLALFLSDGGKTVYNSVNRFT